MSSQTVAWQQGLGQLELNPPPENLSAKLDAIRATQSAGTGELKGEK